MKESERRLITARDDCDASSSCVHTGIDARTSTPASRCHYDFRYGVEVDRPDSRHPAVVMNLDVCVTACIPMTVRCYNIYTKTVTIGTEIVITDLSPTNLPTYESKKDLQQIAPTSDFLR